MAESHHTAVAGSGISADLQDKIEGRLVAAISIIDCVRVLSALERTQTDSKASRLALGAGYAGGETTRDTSMQTALYHAMGLIDEVRCLAETSA